MSQADVSQFEYVLNLLANRMVPPRWFEGRDPQVSRSDGDSFPKRKLVFLLGAGCSRQYGLPSFVELLVYLWEDCLRRPPEPPLRLEVLRDKFDKFWQALGPQDRERLLDRYLSHRVDGSTCPGYHHLARLARDGYVKAIVNMNFDTLLEEAMDDLGVDYRVATSFFVEDDDQVVIYKPHGSVGRVDSEDVFDDLLRAVQEILDAEGPGRVRALGRILRRAEKYLEKKQKLPGSAKEKVAAAEEVVRLASRFIAPEQAGANQDRPALSDLRQAQDSLIQRHRTPVWVDNELILDIANSDLFSDPEEQARAQDLLTRHDVVSVGYSGVDAKIAAALRAFPAGSEPKDKKLFAVNPTPPDTRLLSVMALRASQALLITGQDAGFENFMGCLVGTVEQFKPGLALPGDGDPSHEEKERPAQRSSSLTKAEQDALDHCLRLAQDIRLSMNVAERSGTSIEEHGYQIFGDCLVFAQLAGICLSSAEKYLLHCAAFLHDLGYYRGYTRAKATDYPGWTLLQRHGKLTRELLQERFKESRESTLKPIIPRSYREGDVPFEDLLCTLCEGHSGLVDVDQPIGNTHLFVDGVRVPVRFPLLLALFALAEDLSEGHPFMPSPDFIDSSSGKSAWAIVDPVLDLYLRLGKRPIEFEVKMRQIIVKTKDRSRPETIQWLLTMAAHHIRSFDEEARDPEVGGWGIRLEPAPYQRPELPPSGDPAIKDLFDQRLRLALLEMLEKSLQDIPSGSPGEASALLDLISIYTMSTGSEKNEPEPRVRLDESRASVLDQALQRAREALDGGQQVVPQQSLLLHYLERKRRGALESGSMQVMFCRSFEKIIYPAWRFFARNWHDGIESLLMARACFDLGSSQLRGETLEGVLKILAEKVETEGGYSFAHDRCTLCTSRLLYVLANARRLFPAGSIPHLDEKVNGTVRGVLSYMLSLKAEDDTWWGLGMTSETGGQIRSADYLAWAARSVGFCLSVDRELQARTGQSWLTGACGFVAEDLHRLLRQRWSHLLGAKDEDLLGDLAEEPHSFIFGHVALACLDLKRYAPEIRLLACADADGQVRDMASRLKAVADQLGQLSQLSQFYLWPLQLLLEDEGLGPAAVRNSAASSARSAAEYAAWLCVKCVDSPVWIKKGGDAGSWGFNVKNTQAIVTSLVEFWRYALASAEREARFEEIFRRLETRPGGVVEEVAGTSPRSRLKSRRAARPSARP